MTGDRAAAEQVGGPRCLHDMIAAWCSWCRGDDETLALKAARETPHGIDLVVEINRDLSRIDGYGEHVGNSALTRRNAA